MIKFLLIMTLLFFLCTIDVSNVQAQCHPPTCEPELRLYYFLPFIGNN